MKRRIAMAFIALLFIGTIFLPTNSAAANAWQSDGNQITKGLPEQRNPVICGDGQGGAIIAWEDFRNDPNYQDIYAQKMSSTGAPQWAVNGTPICDATSYQYQQQICGDGFGGAILVWMDYRNSNMDIYAQRVNSEGNTLWTGNGIPIVNISLAQEKPQLCSDGAGGAIIVWEDSRAGQKDIYAQRIKASGQVDWTINGILICNKTGNQAFPRLVSDGTHGAIMCWSDVDVYAQKVTAAGASQWGANGTVICNASNTQDTAELCSDGAGGAIIVWRDQRTDGGDMYAQRISSAGVVQWIANGVEICTVGNTQQEVQICSVDSGGAIMAWRDSRSGSSDDIYAQRVTQNGDMAWIADGIEICNTTDEQIGVRICADGADGAIMAWSDQRFDIDGDIYAQRVSSSGKLLWQFNGTVVCDHTGEDSNFKLTNAGVGAAIITWQDDRNTPGAKNGVNLDIYALKIPIPSGGGGNPGLVLLLLIIPIVGVAVGIVILYLRREQLE